MKKKESRTNRKIRNRIRDKKSTYKNNTFGNNYLNCGSESGCQGKWWKIFYPISNKWRKIHNLKKYCRIKKLNYQYIIDTIKNHGEVKLSNGIKIRKMDE